MIWVFAALMTATLILWLTQPLWRREAAEGAERSAYDLAVYRDQLAELERDLGRGLIGAGEAAAARSEIARRMLAADKSGGAARQVPPRMPWPALGAAVALPLLALVFYARVGQPDMPAQPARERAASPADLPPEQQAQMIRGMVESLAARLATNPDDLPGWRRLARSYRVLGEVDKAREAAAQAARLAPEDIEVLAELAELHSPAGPEAELSPVLIDTLRRMLKIQPDHVQALFFIGLDAMRGGDVAAARAHWERLLKVIPADSAAAVAIRKQIDEMPKP